MSTTTSVTTTTVTTTTVGTTTTGCATTTTVAACDPANYYAGIDPDAPTFKTDLYNLISTHTTLSYAGLWTAFQFTDVGLRGCACNRIGDIYSSKCWIPGTEQDSGSGSVEGDAYNREHSWPKSWWGGGTNAAYTDLHHLYPTDKIVNSLRSDHPFGEVGVPTSTTGNGSYYGPSATSGFTGGVFEPTDMYKGDLARTYFYFVIRYGADGGVNLDAASEGTTCLETTPQNPSLKLWQENMMRAWSTADPVSADEIRRNNIICNQYQGNRNPFVDHPEWIAKISDF